MTHLKFVIIFIVFCFFSSNSYAQLVGSFAKTITFNGKNHTLSYYIPQDYDENKKYSLFIALHGCGGNSTNFRNDLIQFSNTTDVIILCPDFNRDQISGANGQFRGDAISNTINLGYTVDTNSVYMTGFSCNGQEIYKHGWNEIYPFAGIIPFNSWIPVVSIQYNLQSSIPTCVCIGTQDDSYSNNILLYNKFIENGGTGMLNEMPGIGHIWAFPARNDELLECYDWLKSLKSTTSTEEIITKNTGFVLYPNPSNTNYFFIENEEKEELIIQVFNIKGEKILTNLSEETSIRVDVPPSESDIYYVRILNKFYIPIVTKKK